MPLNQLPLLAYSTAVGANSVVTLPLPSLPFLHRGPLNASPTVGTAESLSLEMDRGTFVKRAAATCRTLEVRAGVIPH